MKIDEKVEKLTQIVKPLKNSGASSADTPHVVAPSADDSLPPSSAVSQSDTIEQRTTVDVVSSKSPKIEPMPTVEYN